MRYRGRRDSQVLGVPGRELTTIARRISWLRMRKLWFGLILVAVLVVVVISFFGFFPFVIPIPGFIRGFVAGALISTTIALLVWIALIGDGSMTWRVGAMGELWTSEELRRLGRGWVVLNGLRVPCADESLREIDHIAVGPGGVFVVDSKAWLDKSNPLGRTDTPYVAWASKGAMQQAKIVQGYLGDTLPPSTVSATLMFWGSELASPDEVITTTRDGVRVVHGRDSDAWLHLATSNHVLNESDVLNVRQLLEQCLIEKQPFYRPIFPGDWEAPIGRRFR